MSFEFLDHPADVQIHAVGKDLKECFAKCGEALGCFLTNDSPIELKESMKFTVEGDNLEELIFNFMDEILFIFETELLLFKTIEVTNFKEADSSKYQIEAIGHGENFDLNKHEQGTEIKAITYSALQVLQMTDGVEIYIIVDI
eukprot:TRINITY_DN8060_c0_g1_i1.p1 TRINITY_DN8060_c0_g1~~TRINITY_DN8060_c0_g1_i1.p1  ORF type:complete len:155 (-),score=51.81 TRINITY_DN8060_c0_g1_i1:2-430(-)